MIKQIKKLPAVDQVFRLHDGWYCIVKGRTFGTWNDRGAAQAGMATEQRRANKPKKKKPSQREDGPRAIFSCHKAAEGGQSFGDAKGQLEAEGIVDVRPASSPYVGQYGLSVPKRFEDKTSDILYGKSE